MPINVKQIKLETKLSKLHSKRDNLILKINSNYDLGVHLNDALKQVESDIIESTRGGKNE